MISPSSCELSPRAPWPTQKRGKWWLFLDDEENFGEREPGSVKPRPAVRVLQAFEDDGIKIQWTRHEDGHLVVKQFSEANESASPRENVLPPFSCEPRDASPRSLSVFFPEFDQSSTASYCVVTLILSFLGFRALTRRLSRVCRTFNKAIPLAIRSRGGISDVEFAVSCCCHLGFGVKTRLFCRMCDGEFDPEEDVLKQVNLHRVYFTTQPRRRFRQRSRRGRRRSHTVNLFIPHNLMSHAIRSNLILDGESEVCFRRLLTAIGSRVSRFICSQRKPVLAGLLSNQRVMEAYFSGRVCSEEWDIVTADRVLRSAEPKHEWKWRGLPLLSREMQFEDELEFDEEEEVDEEICDVLGVPYDDEYLTYPCDFCSRLTSAPAEVVAEEGDCEEQGAEVARFSFDPHEVSLKESLARDHREDEIAIRLQTLLKSMNKKSIEKLRILHLSLSSAHFGVAQMFVDSLEESICPIYLAIGLAKGQRLLSHDLYDALLPKLDLNPERLVYLLRAAIIVSVQDAYYVDALFALGLKQPVFEKIFGVVEATMGRMSVCQLRAFVGSAWGSDLLSWSDGFFSSLRVGRYSKLEKRSFKRILAPFSDESSAMTEETSSSEEEEWY